MRRAILLSLITTFIVVLPAHATDCDYEVGPGKQFQTIQPAINQATQSPQGKTVCIYPKSTAYTDGFTIRDVIATDQAPFTVTGITVDSHKPEIRDNTPYSKSKLWGAVINIVDSQHITLSNIEISRTAGRAVVFAGSDYITVSDMLIHHAFNSAIKGSYSDRGTPKGDNDPEYYFTNYSKIIGNTIYESGLVASPQCKNNQLPGMASGENCSDVWADHPEVVNVQTGMYNEISHNVIYHVYGGTISLGQSYGSKITNNYIFDAKRTLMHLGQNNNFLVENNLVYFSTESPFDSKSSGLQQHDEFYSYKLQVPDGPTLDYRYSNSRDVTIRNNIFANVGVGISLLKCECHTATTAGNQFQCVDQDSCGFDNLTIEHNTIIMAEDSALDFLRRAFSRGNSVRYNIFHSTTDGPIASSASYPGFTFANNLWSKQPTAFFQGTNDQVLNQSQFNQVFVQPNRLFNRDNYQPLQVQPDWFATTTQYSIYGADVSTVGPRIDITPAANPTATPTVPAPQILTVLDWLTSFLSDRLPLTSIRY